LVRLLSVPAGEPAAAPAAVLEELERLPEPEPNGKPSPYAPFLEIKVLFNEPEPMFKQQVEEIVARKEVRLARITSVYRSAAGDVPEEESLVSGLQAMNPLQIARTAFQQVYQVEMPGELVDLFQEACFSFGQREEARL
jgi:exonuclease SbcD